MVLATQIPFHPIIKARRPFTIGPDAIAVSAGDVLDLSDERWGLPRNRAMKMVEQHFGEPTTDAVTLEPDAELAPAPGTAPTLYDCPHCDRSYPSGHGLKVHMGRDHKS